MDDKIEDLLALLRGEPGPFLETKTSYFGKKQTDPSMKEASMETDCGGMIITKAEMTYGQADELARAVDLTAFPAFLKTITPSAYWMSPYEDDVPKDKRFRGEVWWAIYSFLATEGYIDGDPKSYKNQMEYLYNLILQRLVAARIFFIVDNEGRWFKYDGVEADLAGAIARAEAAEQATFLAHSVIGRAVQIIGTSEGEDWLKDAQEVLVAAEALADADEESDNECR